MIIIRLDISENKHLLQPEKIISKLMEIFPGTKITLENSYDKRRNAIKELTSERALQGKPFLSRSRMEEDVDEQESTFGSSKEVLIPIKTGVECFKGYICVSQIFLSSEDLVDVPSIKKLNEFLISLNTGEVKIKDNVDEANDQKLKKLLADNKSE